MKYLVKIIFLTLLFVNIKGYSQIKLQYSLSSDDTYKHQIKLEQNISQTIDNIEEKSFSKQIIEYTNTIVNTKNTIYHTKVIYSRVALEQDNPRVEYDSKDKESVIPQDAAGFASLVNSGFEIFFDKQGTITKITGTDQLINTVINAVEGITDSQKKQMKTTLEKQFGSDALKNTMQNNIMIYPKEVINKGYQWSADQLIQTPYPMQFKHRYKLTNYDEENAYIDVSSKIVSNKSKMDFGGFEMEVNLKGTQSGTLSIDRATGILLQSNVTQNINGTIAILDEKYPLSILSKVEVKKLN